MPELPAHPCRIAVQWLLLLAFARLLQVPSASAQVDTCHGDCSHDGAITADEILNGVALALGSAVATECASLDSDQNGRVTVNEILAAVTDAAIRCPAPVPGAQGSDFTEKVSRLAVATIDDLGIVDFGFVGANGTGLIASTTDTPRTRWRLASPPRPAGLRAPVTDGSGGSVVIHCQSGNATLGDCAASTRSVTYNHCRFSVGAETVDRNGVLTQHFDRAESCANLELDQDFNPVIPPNVGVTQEFSGAPEFSETVFAGDGATRLQRTLNLTRTLQPTSGGCVGISGTETLDGSLHFECQPAPDNPECTASIADVTLRAHGLQLGRQSAGTPCMLTMTANGELDVDNRATGESYVQNFGALRITEMQMGGDSVMTEDGTMVTSCLGKVTLQTLSSANQSLRFAPGATCPLQGLLAVTSTAAPSSDAPAETLAQLESAAASGGGASGSTLANQGYRDIAFRAANGPVYQVLQNIDGAPDIGAEDVRITTVVGSQDATLGDPVGQCSGGNVESVVSAAGVAFPPNAVFASGLVTDATAPCFNPNARDGAGQVCIGPDCSRPDCECPIGDCTTFSLRDGGPPITQTTLAARLENTLAGEASDVCRSSERPGSAAYRFGSSGPTTATHVCSARPADGFTLSAGSSIVFAYDTGLLTPFDAGSAGFFIDHDGSNPVSCSGPDKVVGVVAVDRNPIPPPRIRYAPLAVRFDFNGDDKFDDKTLASCLHAPLLQCNGVVPPTPTPTPQQPPRCQPIDLGMADPIDAPIERTVLAGANQANSFGGATCGDGGNHAPDVVFQYRAPVDGYYVIDTLGSSFDTLLYVRDSVCKGPELACNDDASDGETGSLVGLSLHRDNRIIIAVDGSGTASGTVHLKISRSLAAPTPTATATPDLSALPDLVVTAFNAPSDGVIGERITVTSMVKNNGASDAGQFQVAFVYANNPGLTDGLTSSGYACVIPGLAPGASAPCSGSITVPLSLTNGIHYVGAVADSSRDVGESNETNNTMSAMISLTGGGAATPTPTQSSPPTLAATPTATRTSTATPSASAQPTATPTNSGPPTLTATPTTTRTSTATASPSVQPTLTPTSNGTPTFTLVRVIPDTAVGLGPVAVVARDLTGDGRIDLAIANSGSATVSVLSGNGQGIFAATGEFAVGSSDTSEPTALAVGDFNGDARPDVIVADRLDGSVAVLLNGGGGILADPIVSATGREPEAVVAGDFNQDGKLDTATADSFDDSVTVLMGTGDGHFSNTVLALPVGLDPVALVAADLDGDGKLDLVVANNQGGASSTGSLTVLKGNGDGTFTAQVPEIEGAAFDVPVALAAGDLNHDTKIDIVVANETGDSVTILLGDGNLGFGNPMVFSVAKVPESATLADVDGDGVLDIAVTSNFEDVVSVLIGNGDGTFKPVRKFPVGESPLGIATADFNGDGRADLVSTNSNTDTVSVLLNAVPAGSEIQVNSYATNNQGDTAVASDANGNFVVVWESVGQDGSSYGIFGQRFSNTGVPQGTEFQVNTYTTGYQLRAAVASDSTGKFVVVWESIGPDGQGFGVFGRRFSSTGVAQGTEFQVNTYTTNNQRMPDVALDATGNFVVVWQSFYQDGSNYGIFGRRFSSTGVPQGTDFRVNTYTTGVQANARVASDAAGDFTVVWQSNGQDGSDFAVVGRRFSNAGVPQGAEFQVNTYTFHSQEFPAVASDPAGNFVVVWESDGQDGVGNFSVFAQRFSGTGVPQGKEFRVNTYTVGNQGLPAVASDPTGNFVVVWESSGQDGSSYGVFGQRYSSAGALEGTEFQANIYTTFEQQAPSVAFGPTDTFVVVWESNGQDGNGSGVFGRRFMPIP